MSLPLLLGQAGMLQFQAHEHHHIDLPKSNNDANEPRSNLWRTLYAKSNDECPYGQSKYGEYNVVEPPCCQNNMIALCHRVI